MAADLIQAALLYRRQPERTFPVPEGDASIGYDAGNTVRVSFQGVSRRHARITFDGKDYWIEDAGSANGTFLNGNRLTRKERLRHLDIVTLGRRTDLIFVRKTMDSSRVKRRGIAAAHLETLDGPETGRRDEIPKGVITIGRSPSNNVVAESQLISKIHARLERSGVQLVLIDLQSANGTFVEGKRVTSHVLRDGEVFNLGHGRSYRVRLDEGDVFTHDIAMSAARDASVAELPIDWKTRIEWTPEEKAVFDRAAASRKPRTFAQLPAQPTAASRPSKVPAKVAPLPARPAPKSRPAEAKAASPTPLKPTVPAAKPEPPSPSAPAKQPPQTAARAPAGAEPVAGKPQPPATPPPPRAEPKAPAPPAPIPAAPPQPASAPTPRSAAETKRPVPAASITAPAPPSPATPRAAAAPPAKAPTAAPAASVAKESGPPPAVAPPLPQAPVPQSVLSVLPVDPQLTRPLEAKPAGLARVVLEGASARFSLEPGDHEIGRVPGMSVQIEASGISRRHALLHVTDREATLEDLGSKNGSYVNGERIAAPRRLVNGDQLAFGEAKLRVRLETAGP